jgi:hypothetical protein
MELREWSGEGGEKRMKWRWGDYFKSKEVLLIESLNVLKAQCIVEKTLELHWKSDEVLKIHSSFDEALKLHWSFDEALKLPWKFNVASVLLKLSLKLPILFSAVSKPFISSKQKLVPFLLFYHLFPLIYTLCLASYSPHPPTTFPQNFFLLQHPFTSTKSLLKHHHEVFHHPN